VGRTFPKGEGNERGEFGNPDGIALQTGRIRMYYLYIEVLIYQLFLAM
jgi:hypothetical protein